MTRKDIPEFFRPPNYNVTVNWDYLECQLQSYDDRGSKTFKMGGLDLNPDFQRGHVWTEPQQIAYVEFCLKGGQSSRDILFNQPGWGDNYHGTMVLIDGKQRLEAVRKFVRNELPIFDGHYLKDFEDWKILLRSNYAYFNFKINNLPTRKEELEWYLQLNTGGVVHTDEEIMKVKKLLEAEKIP